MSEEFLLVGPLAEPELCSKLGLAGEAKVIRAQLLGGSRAGIEGGAWPRSVDGPQALTALKVRSTPALKRYAAIMGLKPMTHSEGAVLGVQNQNSGDEVWSRENWLPELAAAIAGLVLDEPADVNPEQIARRLPMIGVWAESRLRAASSKPLGGNIVAKREAEDVRLHHRKPLYAGFFGVDEWRISHRTHIGGFTQEVTREGFITGDAVVVLPYDPVRDRVLLIEQFRIAPALRYDPQPWLLEAIAGRIDAGETVEDAARREAEEEANLKLTRLIPAVHYYPTPGAVTEFLYTFVAITDLPDGIAGVYGLDSEAEDIRGHLLPRTELSRMVLEGEIGNGALAMLSLWLDGQAERICSEPPAI